MQKIDGRYWAICSLLAWLVSALTITVQAQESTPTAVASPLDVEGMRAELRRLAEKCDELGLEAEADICRRWLPAERDDQTLLFLPVEAQPEGGTASRSAWVRHFETARKRHAEYWFQACRREAEAGNELTAYRYLWRVLRENAAHAEARRILGRLALATTSSKPQVRRSSGKHPAFGWPGNSYERVESAHFLLTSRASTKETLALAIKLERFYALWSQVFFPLWSPPGLLKARLLGSVSPFENQRQIDVLLLKDKSDYIAALDAREANIGVSVGYYNPATKTSYFYPGDSLDATLFHELTHQLLAETTRINAVSDLSQGSDFWMIEGVAIYMESLWQSANYWTLGGWESPRLQTARYRAIRDGFWIPWDQYHSSTMEQWKQDPNIANLYSQAAGVTHVILDGMGSIRQSQDRREQFIQSLVSVYQGQPKSQSIIQLLGSDAAQENYERALTVTDVMVEQLNVDRQVHDLVLAGSQLAPESWKKIFQLKQLTWLDLSFANATSSDLQSIAELRGLERLSLEGTAIDGSILSEVRKLPKLSELDLTGCHVDDRDLGRLAKHPTLKTLWIGKTPLTDASLPTLASIPKLTFVDISASKISATAWQKFVQQNPRFASASQ